MDRILTDHRINHEENFVGLGGITYISRLLHEDFINTEPAGCINDDNIVFSALCFRNARGRDPNRVAM